MSGTEGLFPWREPEDRWGIWIALAVAAGIHGCLLLIPLPQTGNDAVEAAAKREIFTVQSIRFKLRPPEPQDLPRAAVLPIPIPEPLDPEPLRPPDELLELPEALLPDLPLDIPPEPPPLAEAALDALPERPIQVGGEVVPPAVYHAPMPQYTKIARLARREGSVLLQGLVDEQGRVVEARVLRGLGLGLDEAALEAMKQWRFEPATLHGRPVAVYYKLTVNFQLQ